MNSFFMNIAVCHGKKTRSKINKFQHKCGQVTSLKIDQKRDPGKYRYRNLIAENKVTVTSAKTGIYESPQQSFDLDLSWQFILQQCLTLMHFPLVATCKHHQLHTFTLAAKIKTDLDHCWINKKVLVSTRIKSLEIIDFEIMKWLDVSHRIILSA